MNDILLTIRLLPNVLIQIIMEYINYDYILEFVRYNGNLCFKQIINTQTDTYLIQNYTYICLEEKIINPRSDRYLRDLITDFYNYFMMHYYNKQKYIFNSEKKYYLKNNYFYPEGLNEKTQDIPFRIIKVNNYKEVVNMIVIFKIFFKIMFS